MLGIGTAAGSAGQAGIVPLAKGDAGKGLQEQANGQFGIKEALIEAARMPILPRLSYTGCL